MGNKTVTRNGSKVDMIIAPKEIKEVVYVPLRIVSQIAKLPISVNSETKTVQIGKEVLLDVFFHMNWEMSTKQVRNIENRTKISEGAIVDEDGEYELKYSGEFGDLNLPGTITYYFIDDKLSKANIEISYKVFKESLNVYTQLSNHLDAMYVKYVENDEEPGLLWTTDYLAKEEYLKSYKKDTMGMWNDAIKNNDLRLISVYGGGVTGINSVLYNKGIEKKPEFTVSIIFFPSGIKID